MTQASGWYDDPQDPSQLRYWDGVIWSSHVTPKVSPTVEASNIGMPYNVAPAGSRPRASGSQGAEGPEQGSGQWPAYGRGPGQMPSSEPGWGAHRSTTPDGVPLSGWWLRALARVLDGLFTFILSLPLTGWFYYGYLSGVMSWSKDLAAQEAAGSTPVFAFPPWDVLQHAVNASLIGLLVAGAYEVYFLRRSGATPGKKIVGISVRLRDHAGQMPMATIVIRTLCYFGFSLFSILNLLDVLWPLWDDKKQALHDKVVATNVVLGPQPKRTQEP
ncbi:MAG: RDD family protein [Actinomycetota bacterium]